jgi:hypothetical protein
MQKIDSIGETDILLPYQIAAGKYYCFLPFFKNRTSEKNTYKIPIKVGSQFQLSDFQIKMSRQFQLSDF